MSVWPSGFRRGTGSPAARINASGRKPLCQALFRRSAPRVITLRCAAALLVVLAAGVLALPGGAAAGAADPCGGQPCTWNFGQARIPAAQPLGRAGMGVTVAVVDTWVDAAHPDFGGRIMDSADCVGGTCRDYVSTSDGCVHGTHVAGTVASTHYGVAPQARILSVRVLAYDPGTGECAGSTADVAAGIRFAATHGARVINLSLGNAVPGLFQSGDVTAAVSAAARSGAVVVFAAGNSTAPITDSYGADALLVAATGPDGTLAGYSSRGGSVGLAAPGGDSGAGGLRSCRSNTCIASTTPGNTYGLLEGTSMAAPHVSGTAALLFAQDPGRDRTAVIDALTATAHPLPDAGHGLLDADAALHHHTPPPTPRPTGGQPGPGLTPGHVVGAPSVIAEPLASTPPPVTIRGENPRRPDAASGSDPVPAPSPNAGDQGARTPATPRSELPWAAVAVVAGTLTLGAIATWRTARL